MIESVLLIGSMYTISIWCNRIEHRVHLRCAGIRQAQYTETWTCHLHRESRLTSHTEITLPHPSRPWSQPNTHSPPPQPKHRHTSNTPAVLTGLVKPKRNPLIHSPPCPPTPPRANHIHISHTSPTPLIPSTTLIHITSAELDTIAEPRVQPTCPALITSTHHPSPTPALPSPSQPHSLSAYTHATQSTVHASQSQQPPHPHRVPRQPNKQTKHDHMTTDTPQGHRPSSRSERNLPSLQVNINGIKNKLGELKLLIHDTHADIITIQEAKITLQANTPKYIYSPLCMPIGCTIVQAANHQVQPTVQYFKAEQTYSFKRDPSSDEGNQEETIGDGMNIHRGPINESNQEL